MHPPTGRNFVHIENASDCQNIIKLLEVKL
jgi:hypothetical protein